MKIPSIAVLTQGLFRTLRRWPVSIAFAIATSLLLIWISHEYRGDRERLWVIIFSCYEGMLLTIAATILAETRGWKMTARSLLQALAVGLALLFYFWLPVQEVRRVISFLVVTLALHFLIAVVPYPAAGDSMLGFWDYNRKLFLRALQTALYTLVLYAGISLALLAIEHLFGVNFEYAYTNTWWILAGMFNPVFFLAGVPRVAAGDAGERDGFPIVYARPEAIVDYPRGLKVFTQFVLLPLVTIYLAILYAYLFKIVFTAVWPSGWVAYLVLGFSVAGILALLLIWPLRNDEDNRWIRTYSRFFYLALIPLIILLWIAIGKRMGSYGITEGRYYVLLLAAWLSGIACYFVFSGRKDIRLIPATLSVLALLSLWGPWSARRISLASQVSRMKTLLEKDGVLVQGKIVPVKRTRTLPLDDRKQVSSIVEYITEMHDYRELQPLFSVNLDSALKHEENYTAENYWGQSRDVVRLIGFEYVERYQMEDITLNNYYHLQEDHPVLRTNDVEYILPGVMVGSTDGSDSSWTSYAVGTDSIRLRIDSSRHILRIIADGAGGGKVAGGARGGSDIDLRPLERAIADSLSPAVYGNLHQSTMTMENASFRVVATTVITARRDRLAHVVHLECYLMRLVASGVGRR